MKINLTKEEYKTLVKALFLANWVISAYEVGEKPAKKPFSKLEQKILSLAKDFGQDNLVEYDEDLKMYFNTRKFEDELLDKFITPYDNYTFWEELIDRLSKRDLFSDYGQTELQKMEEKEIIEKLSQYEDIYSKEFEENGIENLKIVNM